MGANTTAGGSMIRDMEWGSSDIPMGIFANADGKIIKDKTSDYYGFLMATSFKADIRMIKWLISI
jgi:hypothetical protein